MSDTNENSEELRYTIKAREWLCHPEETRLHDAYCDLILNCGFNRYPQLWSVETILVDLVVYVDDALSNYVEPDNDYWWIEVRKSPLVVSMGPVEGKDVTSIEIHPNATVYRDIYSWVEGYVNGMGSEGVFQSLKNFQVVYHD